MIMKNLTGSPSFQAATAYIENGPHSVTHGYLGFSMATMSSPDEPLFFLHHCFIDRLYHLWQDCWDYEFIEASALTAYQYLALNPSPPPSPTSKVSINVYVKPNVAYNVSIDKTIFY
jgi:hypothetical protein